MALKVEAPTASQSRPLGEIKAKPRGWRRLAALGQFVRFGIVGVLNTVIDVLTLNLLLWRFPSHNPNLLLLFNSIAYILGALNSFGLNKYWTFKRRSAITSGEIIRFIAVNVVGFLCNDGIIWLSARALHPFILNNLLWANASKAIAVIGTMIISYTGMRFWVFATRSRGEKGEN